MALISAISGQIPVLRQVSTPGDWTACVLKASYPLEPSARATYQQACELLLSSIPAFSSPRQEVLLQFDRLDPKSGVALLQRNARAWLPEVGLGMWPHRGSPTLWTREEFEDANVGELRPLMHKVFRIQPDRQATSSAWEEYLGSGVLVRAAVQNPDEFYETSMERLQPTITELALASFPLYVPLLEAAALKSATGDLLADWLCGAEAYARESAEDGGLFLLFPGQAQQWLTALSERLHRENLKWTIEYAS